MDAKDAVELVHRAANAYCQSGMDGANRGILRKWVAKEERTVTKQLLTALIGRKPSTTEIEESLSD